MPPARGSSLGCQEALYEELLALLKSLQVDSIHRDWTRKIWDEDFQLNTFEVLSPPYEDFQPDDAFVSVLLRIVNCLKQEVQSNRRVSTASTSGVNFSEIESSHAGETNQPTDDLFRLLPSQQIEMRRLLAFFSYLFELGRRETDDLSQKISLLAISVYYLLLSLRGSSGYLVFVDSLFSQSLTVLKSFLQQEMFQEVTPVVLNLQIMLTHFKLKGRREIIQTLVEFLLEIASMEPTRAVLTEENLHVYSSNIFIICYQNLKLLLNEMHGSPFESMKDVMCHLLPIVLGSGKNSKASENIRSRSVSFLMLLSDIAGPPGKKALVGFIQQLCLNVEDKVDSRKRATDTVFALLKIIPSELLLKIMKWLMLMTFHNSVSLRTYALEIICRVLTDQAMISFLINAFNEETTYFRECRDSVQNTRPKSVADDRDNETENEPEVEVKTQTFHDSIDMCGLILGTIFSRLWDNTAGVRAKAMAAIANCLMCDVKVVKSKLSAYFRMFQGTMPSNSSTGEPVDIRKALIDSNELEEYFPNLGDFLFILFASLTEKTVKERKQAVELLFKIIETEDCFLTEKFVKIACQNCRDPSVIIRQTALSLVTDLMIAKPCEVTRNVWIQNILPATEDREEKIVKQVFESMENVLLRQFQGGNEVLAFELLGLINVYGYRQQLMKVCTSWSKEQKLKPALVSTLQNHLEGEFKTEAWFFLSIVCRFISVKSGDFAADAFEQLLSCQTDTGADVHTLQLVLQTLVSISMQMSAQKIEGLYTQILNLLKSFVLPPELIPIARDVVLSATKKMYPQDWETVMLEWSSDIVKLCDIYLSEKILKNAPEHCEDRKSFEDQLNRRMISLGDMAQLCPGRVSSRACVAVQSVVFPCQGEEPLSASQPIPSSQIPASQPVFCSFRPSPLLQSAGLVTLGKLCLQNEKLAKQVVPALGKLLGSSNESSMKNNIVHVLCDIIIRYASLADPLMPHVLLCLRDDHIRVRRNTLSLLIGLLQEDYLKLRENFFYRIVQMIIDDDPKIKEMAVYYVTQRLLPRKPKVLSQHFIESVFHFNDHQTHASFNKFQQSAQERHLFSLAGDKKKEERFRIYGFMLEHMNDEERFTTLYNLCRDILKPVHEGVMPIPDPQTEAVLQDALKLIACKEIKLNLVKGGKPADEDPDMDEAAQAVIEGVRKAVITHVVKKNYIENIVPTIVKLKHDLEQKRSPLLGDLMNSLKEIVKDYKNEVSEIFAADRQLATEVEYDLKKYEEACKRKEDERLIAIEREKRRSERRAGVNVSLNISIGPDEPEKEVAGDGENKNCDEHIGRKRSRSGKVSEEISSGRATPAVSTADEQDELHTPIPPTVKPTNRKKKSMLVSTPLPNDDDEASFKTQDISIITPAMESGRHFFKTPAATVSKVSSDLNSSPVRKSSRLDGTTKKLSASVTEQNVKRTSTRTKKK